MKIVIDIDLDHQNKLADAIIEAEDPTEYYERVLDLAVYYERVLDLAVYYHKAINSGEQVGQIKTAFYTSRPDQPLIQE